MASGLEKAAQEQVRSALVRLNLVDPEDEVCFTPLTGGVSSDIWRVDRPNRASICVKQASPQLRVEADWRVPVERNAFEAAWLRCATDVVPGIAPRLLGQDPASGLLAMEYLPPESHPVWKSQLLAGNADPATAAAVAQRLGRLHAATAQDEEVARAFQTDDIFWGIRLEPYLVATGAVHPDLRATLVALAESTSATHLALVHGDVSPKNILVGPNGPIIIDAECAWYGDPAFDLAFCLNHLLLKCLAVPAASAGLLECFKAMVAAYLACVSWEPTNRTEGRAAALLPALTLARVDGKSPVEYITADDEKAFVRNAAIPLIENQPQRLHDVAAVWKEALADAGY